MHRSFSSVVLSFFILFAYNHIANAAFEHTRGPGGSSTPATKRSYTTYEHDTNAKIEEAVKKLVDHLSARGDRLWSENSDPHFGGAVRRADMYKIFHSLGRLNDKEKASKLLKGAIEKAVTKDDPSGVTKQERRDALTKNLLYAYSIYNSTDVAKLIEQADNRPDRKGTEIYKQFAAYYELLRQIEEAQDAVKFGKENADLNGQDALKLFGQARNLVGKNDKASAEKLAKLIHGRIGSLSPKGRENLDAKVAQVLGSKGFKEWPPTKKNFYKALGAGTKAWLGDKSKVTRNYNFDGAFGNNFNDKFAETHKQWKKSPFWANVGQRAEFGDEIKDKSNNVTGRKLTRNKFADEKAGMDTDYLKQLAKSYNPRELSRFIKSMVDNQDASTQARGAQFLLAMARQHGEDKDKLVIPFKRHDMLRGKQNGNFEPQTYEIVIPKKLAQDSANVVKVLKKLDELGNRDGSGSGLLRMAMDLDPSSDFHKQMRLRVEMKDDGEVKTSLVAATGRPLANGPPKTEPEEKKVATPKVTDEKKKTITPLDKEVTKDAPPTSVAEAKAALEKEKAALADAKRKAQEARAKAKAARKFRKEVRDKVRGKRKDLIDAKIAQREKEHEAAEKKAQEEIERIEAELQKKVADLKQLKKNNASDPNLNRWKKRSDRLGKKLKGKGSKTGDTSKDAAKIINAISGGLKDATTASVNTLKEGLSALKDIGVKLFTDTKKGIAAFGKTEQQLRDSFAKSKVGYTGPGKKTRERQRTVAQLIRLNKRGIRNQFSSKTGKSINAAYHGMETYRALREAYIQQFRDAYRTNFGSGAAPLSERAAEAAWRRYAEEHDIREPTL